jgi:hypothetical protein
MTASTPTVSRRILPLSRLPLLAHTLCTPRSVGVGRVGIGDSSHRSGRGDVFHEGRLLRGGRKGRVR